jgi:hypothetical protein
MTIPAQASDGGTWIFLTLGIAIGLVVLAAWLTHLIWLLRSLKFFRSLGMGNLRNAHYWLGVIGFAVPIVGVIHGFAIWAGAGAQVGDSAPIVTAGQAGGRRMPWWAKALIFSVIWLGVVVAAGYVHTDVFLAGQITQAQDEAISGAYGSVAASGLFAVWGICFLFFVLRRTSASQTSRGG